MQTQLSRLVMCLALGTGALFAGCDSGGSSEDTGEGGECTDPFPDATKDPDVESLQTFWGTACTSDQDCIDSMGFDNAFCVGSILGVYELPDGYCSRHCTLPDDQTPYVHDDPACDENGGISCVGVMGFFEACAPQCDSDSQCGREAYACQIMPLIASEGDPTYCLMHPDACCLDPAQC
jgi:hypothetical protein